jgi:hypothetical protein
MRRACRHINNSSSRNRFSDRHSAGKRIQTAALARDLFIRAIGPQRMLARQDWIYDRRV